MIDTATALEASATWATLARLVPTIELYLTPRPGKSEVRLPPKSKPPIDLVASDLLAELDQSANFYMSALLMETNDVKRFPDGLAAQLALVGERHGHWTADTDEKIATDYCDEAHEMMRKVTALVAPQDPQRWAGECQTCNEGALWLDVAKERIRCDACNSAVDMGTWRDELLRGAKARVMDREEILFALVCLGHRVKAATLRQWIHRGRLVPIIREPEAFRFDDVLTVAKIEVAA